MKSLSNVSTVLMLLLGLLSGLLASPSSFAQYFGQNCNKYEAAFRSDIPASQIFIWSGVATLATSVVHGEDKNRNDESTALSVATGLLGIGTSIIGTRQACSISTSVLAADVAADDANPEDTVEKRAHLRAMTAQAVALNAIANIILYSNTKNLNVKSIATIGAVLPIGLLTYYWDDFQVLEPVEDEASIAFQMTGENPMLFVRWTY